MKELECYEELANAIIIKAVEDYKSSCQIIRTSKDKFELNNAKSEKERIIRFINSDYYEVLTSIPRETLFKKLKIIEKEAKQNEFI